MADILETWNYPSEWLKYEEDSVFSREDITILAGSGSPRVLLSGMVLGKITAGAASATSAAVAGNIGNGAMGTVTTSAGAVAGTYRLTVIEPAANGGAFMVEDPGGINVGHGSIGSAFSGGGLAFTLADGATDFVAGDQFTIAVTIAAGSGKWTQLNLSATDGSQTAAGILFLDTTAPDGVDKRAVAIVSHAIVNDKTIKWPVGISSPQIAAATLQLRAGGIKVREGA